MSDLHPAFLVEKDIVRAHAKWWGPEAKARRDANYALAAERPGAAISKWTAEERSRVLGQELGEELGVWSTPLMNLNLVRGRHT